MATVSNSVNEMLALGLKHHEQGQLQEAERYYKIALHQNPTNAEALRLIGVLGYQTGNYSAAHTFFERAVGFNPISAPCRKAYGANLLALGKYEQAISEFSAVIRFQPDSAEAYFDRAVAEKSADRLEQAEADYKKAIALQPNHFGAQNNLGNLLKQLGRLAEARTHFEAAFLINPEHPEIINNLGVMDLQSGELESAAAKFTKAHTIAPDTVNPIKNLAECMALMGKYDNAEICYTRAVGMSPTDPALWLGYGKLLELLGRQEQALECYRRTSTLDAHACEAILLAAKIIFSKSMFQEGVDYLTSALEINPDNQDIKNNLAICMFEAGRREEGLALLRECIEFDPTRFELQNNLGNFLRAQGDLDGAIIAFEKAHQIDSKRNDPVYNLGVLYEEEQKYDIAERYYRQAKEIEPEAVNVNWNLALVLLKQGNYLEGWRQYEWRWKWPAFTSPRRDFPQPLWLGEDLTGKTLLVHGEQGLGDTIQFIRYLPLIKANQEKIILEVSPALKRLARSVVGVPEEVLSFGEALPWFDRQVPMMSLPLAFKTALESVPAQVPYLQPETEEVVRWKERLAGTEGKFRIGIVWAGNTEHTKDAKRSARFEYFVRLADIPGVQLVSLQKGPGQAQIKESARQSAVIDVMDEVNDFAETLGLMANLDLIISVDTSVAHLAGAANLPIWILIAHNPDYRWMMEREDTPWYPSAKLFRQPKESDWDGVISRLEAEIRIKAR